MLQLNSPINKRLQKLQELNARKQKAKAEKRSYS